MKTYIIYLDGNEKGMLKARNHNEAERKAQKKFPDIEPYRVQVAYTEI